MHFDDLRPDPTCMIAQVRTAFNSRFHDLPNVACLGEYHGISHSHNDAWAAR